MTPQNQKRGDSLEVASLIYCLFLSALFLLPFRLSSHDCDLEFKIRNKFYLKFAINVDSFRKGAVA